MLLSKKINPKYANKIVVREYSLPLKIRFNEKAINII
jgi:hypothetical protein